MSVMRDSADFNGSPIKGGKRMRARIAGTGSSLPDLLITMRSCATHGHIR